MSTIGAVVLVWFLVSPVAALVIVAFISAGKGPRRLSTSGERPRAATDRLSA